MNDVTHDLSGLGHSDVHLFVAESLPKGIGTKRATTYNIITKIVEIKEIKDIPEYTHVQIASS